MLTKAEPTAPMREHIRGLAQELYMRGGYEGFSFGDIAAALGITRANVHYHFGSKRQLMAAMIDGFVEDALARIARHWSSPGDGFAERLRRQCADLRAFHHHFNPMPEQRHVWSPVSRLRLDLPFLGDLATVALQRVNHGYDQCLRRAVLEAIEIGELRDDAPVDDIVRLLRTTIMSCGPITQDQGSFGDVDALFVTIGRTIATAWGTQGLRIKLA